MGVYMVKYTFSLLQNNEGKQPMGSSKGNPNWKKGMPSPNPSGRNKLPKVGKGRVSAMRILDQLLDLGQNKHTLKQALQDEFDKDPVQFYKTFVLPFTPKETTLQDAMPRGVEILIVTGNNNETVRLQEQTPKYLEYEETAIYDIPKEELEPKEDQDTQLERQQKRANHKPFMAMRKKG